MKINCKKASVRYDPLAHVLCSSPIVAIKNKIKAEEENLVSPGFCHLCPDRVPLDIVKRAIHEDDGTPVDPFEYARKGKPLPINPQAIESQIAEAQAKLPEEHRGLFASALERFSKATGINQAIGHTLWQWRHDADASELAASQRESQLLAWESCLSLIKSCGCGATYQQIKASIPPPAFDAGSEAWFAWGVQLHNKVNLKLGKPQKTIEAVRRIRRGDKRKLILKYAQCPGDTVCLTAAVRDLALAHPDKFDIDVRACAADIFFAGNPFITPIDDVDREAEIIECQHTGEGSGKHYIESITERLAFSLGIKIPTTAIKGDLYLADDQTVHPLAGKPYWVLVAGGKASCTVKIPPAQTLRQVVSALPEIIFVQTGQAPGNAGGDTHYHPRILGSNIVDMVGKTDWRQMIHLIAHAQGVLCGITAAGHIAAALGVPAVVIAAGREKESFVGYPNQKFLSSVGKLPCCLKGGCWKDRTVQLHFDGDNYPQANKPDRLCVDPVKSGGEMIPHCMSIITADEIVSAISA